MPPLLALFFLCLSLALRPATAVSSPSFALDFFPAAGAIAQLSLSGGATANATAGSVSMPIPDARVQYRTPIAASALRLGFSTYFAFALPHAPSADTDTLHVQLAATRIPTANHHPTPTPPLLSYPLHLLPVLRRGPILAGFRTSSGNCTLFSWAFRAAPNRMHSLPLNPADLLTTPPPEREARASQPAPDRRYSSPWGAALSLLLAAAAGAMLTFIVLFLWYYATKRRPVAPVEYPMHPSHVVYEKIVLVGVKDDDAAADAAGNK
ncbi:hypothetical protein Zm00014a_029500 [Zea mays]|uniref:Legume lectin domain-containing protein n=1 Tax=Zea mays TaxID=4577 RepID=A0A3L6E0Q2_MAIZE|nr:hypothetical protein Zm00014a_029500 [Zea mays]